MRAALALATLVALMLAGSNGLAVEKGKGARSAEGKVVAKSRADFISGVIEDLDLSSGRITVRGRTKRISFAVTDPSRFRWCKVGDRVSVRYVDNTALSVMPIRSVNRVAGDNASPAQGVGPPRHPPPSP